MKLWRLLNTNNHTEKKDTEETSTLSSHLFGKEGGSPFLAQACDVLLVCCLPYLHVGILGAGGDELAVGRPAHAVDIAGMFTVGEDGHACGGLPYEDVVVSV